MLSAININPLKLVLILAIAIPSITAGAALVQAATSLEAASKDRFAGIEQLED